MNYLAPLDDKDYADQLWAIVEVRQRMSESANAHSIYYAYAFAWTDRNRCHVGFRESNNRTIFYFKDLTDAKAFRKAQKDFPTEGKFLFPQIGDLGGEPEWTAWKIAEMISFDLGERITDESIAIWLWCRENLRGRVFEHGAITIFEYEDDATMFRLRYMK